MDEPIQVPQSLLKLERMRVQAMTFHATNRELQERVSSLHRWITELHSRNAEVRRRFQGLSADQQVRANDRTIAAMEKMKEVAQAAIDLNNDVNADEARLYNATKQHLLGELKAWGIE